jgi:uncharacterized protein with GYD domain
LPKGALMPRYVSLINWTDQGVRNYRDSVRRAENARAAAEQLGGRILDVYWTVGRYDSIVVVEAPDDETMTSFLLQLGSQGNVRTQTLRAYDADEMSRIIERTG